MSADWQPLRDHLREHAEAWLDDLIRHDPDRQARAYLAAHRAAVVERMLEKAEIAVLRQHLADQNAEAES